MYLKERGGGEERGEKERGFNKRKGMTTKEGLVLTILLVLVMYSRILKNRMRLFDVKMTPKFLKPFFCCFLTAIFGCHFAFIKGRVSEDFRPQCTF